MEYQALQLKPTLPINVRMSAQVCSHPSNPEDESWETRVCALMSRKSKCLKRNLFTGARDVDLILDDECYQP